MDSDCDEAMPCEALPKGSLEGKSLYHIVRSWGFMPRPLLLQPLYVAAVFARIHSHRVCYCPERANKVGNSFHAYHALGWLRVSLDRDPEIETQEYNGLGTRRTTRDFPECEEAE